MSQNWDETRNPSVSVLFECSWNIWHSCYFDPKAGVQPRSCSYSNWSWHQICQHGQGCTAQTELSAPSQKKSQPRDGARNQSSPVVTVRAVKPRQKKGQERGKAAGTASGALLRKRLLLFFFKLLPYWLLKLATHKAEWMPTRWGFFLRFHLMQICRIGSSEPNTTCVHGCIYESARAAFPCLAPRRWESFFFSNRKDRGDGWVRTKHTQDAEEAISSPISNSWYLNPLTYPKLQEFVTFFLSVNLLPPCTFPISFQP